MRLIILIGIIDLVCFAVFFKRETKVVEVTKVIEVEVPKVVEVVQTETVIKYVDRPQPVPVLVWPKPVIVKPNIDWDDSMLQGVKFFEGYRESVYTCSGGVRTIGYGCTDKSVVSKGRICKDTAEDILVNHLERVKKKVDEVVVVELTEYQLNALTSFAFNCGMSNLKTLVSGKNRLNSGNYESISKIMPMYRKAGGKVREGLVKRRAWELSLWEGKLKNL